MPVPTETFRDIRKLNLIFAASSIVLAISVVLLVMADYVRDWRGYQQKARVWETAYTEDAARLATAGTYREELQQYQAQLAQLRKFVSPEELAALEEELSQVKAQRDARSLPLATVKGEITPKQQQVERATLEFGPDAPQVQQLRAELAEIVRAYEEKALELANIEQRVAELTQEIKTRKESIELANRKITDLERKVDKHKERLAEVNPQGVSGISEQIRNAPLTDWFNPSMKVQQVVVPGVRTDLNLVTIETIDRCASCHINIENPLFEQNNQINFLERQIASYQGQDLDSLTHAVVLLDFWEAAAIEAGQVGRKKVDQARELVLKEINALRTTSGMEELKGVESLEQEFDRIALEEDGNDKVNRKRWYQALQHYRGDLQAAIKEQAGQEQMDLLTDLYRHQLIQVYNDYRAGQKLPALSASRVLLAHPDLDLYVGPESKHPIKTMGCTSCHEGSGQETSFQHTAHTPRNAWVDSKTGAFVPTFLLDRGHTEKNHKAPTHAEPQADHAQADHTALEGVQLASAQDTGETVASLAKPDSATTTKKTDHAVRTHHDLNLNNPGNPAPFAPVVEEHADALAYHNPAQDQQGKAIRLADYWTKQFGWHEVHFMEWERPMHAMEFIESNCNRCHTEIYDIQKTAPTLFKGRQLFAQMGCVNCHSVESLKDDLDVKQVGPSLVHVDQKLSEEMLASWIWAPKAFRPMTRMPHLFMLENNSSPRDIARTRVEVAAITSYLKTTPAPNAAEYEPEAPPEEPGDVDRGHLLFNQTGCLACHTNMADSGERWIVDDLVERVGATAEEAKAKYGSMSYNQRHQYALEHLPEKIVQTGPELSAVGTKLKAGRTPEQARQWLYDWLRNPRHYNSYTIMPDFRLSEQEANDMAAYLLTLERDDYQTGEFMTLDEQGKQMLDELVIGLKAGAMPRDLFVDTVHAMPQKEKLNFLGQKMISNYGCNSCHEINGIPSVPIAPELNGWGFKDPHKLDFGYFDHAFDKQREQVVPVWKVAQEGLAADAPLITADSEKVARVPLEWEHLEHDRRGWIYNKLHNTRLYDRAKYPSTHDDMKEGVQVAMEGYRPYDKLKMPKFFLRDDQVRALVTFVTSLRPPLVDPSLQKVVDDAGERVIRGQQVATLYNCYGCHNIEGNMPHIRQFFESMPDGTHNPNGFKWAPPRLVGQGAKTQPTWLFNFLQNVEPIRPWLQVRMPSFPLEEQEASTLVDYFTGHSQLLSERLNKWEQPIEALEVDAIKAAKEAREAEELARAAEEAGAFDAEIKKLDADDKQKVADDKARVAAYWFDTHNHTDAVKKLRQFAIESELVKPEEIDPRGNSPESRREAWARVLENVRFLAHTYDAPYPYAEQHNPDISRERFVRGEKFIGQMGCLAGNCHNIGDPDLLEQIAALDKAAAASAAPAGDGYDDGYGDDGYGDAPADDGYGDAPADDGYGDDGYGDAPSEDAKPAASAELNKFAAAPPGDPAAVKAPNLIRTGYRLQRRWVEQWVQKPHVIQPGTWMLSFFPEGKSQFANIPQPIRGELESTYGYTGQAQRDLLMDFLISATYRNYTPGAEAVTGIKSEEVELTPLEKPKEKAVDQTGESGEVDAEVVEVAPIKPAQATPPAEEKTTSDIELHDEAAAPYSGTRVVGVVKFDGRKPRRRPIRMEADPFCSKAHKGPVLDETLVVHEGGLFQNVFIHVKSGLPAGDYKLDAQPVIDQRGCLYVPHVTGVMAGSPFAIRTSDATVHNVRITSDKNGNANFSMLGIPGLEETRTFSQSELGIRLQCDVHPWMSGVVHVVDHPFFSVSDVEGRFEITGLPPGKYTLEAVHEVLPPVVFEVEVKAETSVREDVTFQGK